MAQERELSVSVNTLAQTEQALKRLDNLESNTQVSKYLQIPALITGLCVLVVLATSSNCTHSIFVCLSWLSPSGGDGSGSDHHPSWTPAVSRSPLRHGSYHATGQ